MSGTKDKVYNLLIRMAGRFAPSSRLRKKFRNIAKNTGKNNKIVIIKNGKEYISHWLNGFDGLNLKITGDNNVVRLTHPIQFKNSIIEICGSNCEVEIGEKCNFKNLSLYMAPGELSTVCKIGNSVRANGRVAINMRGASKLIIEEGCLFASGVIIRTTDSHAILDKDSGEVLNKQKHPLTIGKHSWIGKNVFLTKNTVVPPNTIIGAMSLVAGKFSEEHTCIAGNPAKIIKRNVTWKHANAEYYA